MANDYAPVETPDFLARLGLRADADARAIKRAYAREVKLIDQEADIIGFQDLRDAYETALRWAAYQIYLAEQAALEDTPEAQESEPHAPPEPADPGDPVAAAPAPVSLAKSAPEERLAPAPEPAGADPVDPDALSKTVFDRLMASIDLLTRGRMLSDVSLFEEELNRRLDDDELFNITARAIFEARIAYHLAAGWQKGNETLLPAAASVFNWVNDRRRLYQFGQAGSMANQAIDERNLFDQQSEMDVQRQRSIMHRLRDAKVPTKTGLREDVPQLEVMLERFPAMMHMLTPRETFQQWRELYAALGEDNTPAPAVQLPDPMPEPVLNMGAPSSNGSSSSFGGWGFGIIMLIMALRAMFSLGENHSTERAAKPPIDTVRFREALSKHQQEQEQAYRDAIRDDIRYTPGPAVAPGLYSADFIVHYDPEGKIETVTDMNGSADPNYDRAVKEAILRAKPYQAHIGKESTLILKYNFRVHPRLSRAELDTISANIRYKVRPDTPVGVYRVEFEVSFDELGKAVGAKLIKASLDPLYDKAVRQAILRMKPVKSNPGKPWQTTVIFGGEIKPQPASKSTGTRPGLNDSNARAPDEPTLFPDRTGQKDEPGSTSSPPAAD